MEILFLNQEGFTFTLGRLRLVFQGGKVYFCMAGSVQLVQSVYQNLFLHGFSVYQWPTNLLKHLFFFFCARNFIWSGDLVFRKLVIVAWYMVCGSKR